MDRQTNKQTDRQTEQDRGKWSEVVIVLCDQDHCFKAASISQSQSQQPQAAHAAQPVQLKASQRPPADNSSIHLAIPKMSEEDLLQFKQDKFVLGKVPECPPPPELC
jgi:hypothetical protein